MDAIFNLDVLEALIDARVERKLAERLAATVEQQPQPLGIDPEKAYTRQEACAILGGSSATLARDEKRGRLKRLKNAVPIRYRGRDLLHYRGLL